MRADQANLRMPCQGLYHSGTPVPLRVVIPPALTKEGSEVSRVFRLREVWFCIPNAVAGRRDTQSKNPSWMAPAVRSSLDLLASSL